MRALAAAALGLLLLPRPARAGEAAPVDLVVYWAAAEPPADAARDALLARARLASIAWLDLSPAAGPVPQADALRRRGVEAYEALRFDDGLAALDAAIDEAGRTGAAGLDPATLSYLFLYRGLIQTQRGDAARAWEDLLRAAAIDPARLLDPSRFPPRAVEAFQRALEHVRGGPRGELTVQAPPGCAVVIDGAEAPSRATGGLPFGEHIVRVDCRGRRRWVSRVLLAAPAQSLTAEPVEERPPTDEEVRGLARGRGAVTVAVAVVSAAGGGQATLSVRLLDVASGRARIGAGAALPPESAAAAGEVLARVLSPPPAPAPRGQHWYQHGWLWAAAGAAAAGALLLPFALGDGPSTDVLLRPTGFSW